MIARPIKGANPFFLPILEQIINVFFLLKKYPQGGDRVCFSPLLVKTIIFVLFFVLENYPQVGEREWRGEVQDYNCTIDVIFVINRNFLNKYSENRKILMNKM